MSLIPSVYSPLHVSDTLPSVNIALGLTHLKPGNVREPVICM